MGTDINEYLFKVVRPKKERLQQIVVSASDSIRFLSYIFDDSKSCFPSVYAKERVNEGDYISITNQAQCVFTIGRILKNVWWRGLRDNIVLSEKMGNKVEKCMLSLLRRIEETSCWKSTHFKDMEINKDTKDTKDRNSFTASWIALMLDACITSKESDAYKKSLHFLKSDIFKILCRSVDEGLRNPHNIASNRNLAGAHAFTIDRCVVAARALLNLILCYQLPDCNEEEESLKEGLEIAKAFVRSTFYQHVGYHTSGHFGFDPAELILSLSSLSAMEEYLTPDDPILKIALDIIVEDQSSNKYWRPHRPFFMQEDGFVLLPLSVDSANALLRIATNAKCFERLEAAFEHYFAWAEKQKKCMGSESEHMCAWRSENTPSTDASVDQTVATFQAAQMALFLVEYGGQLAQHVKADLLRESGFSFLEPSKLEVEWPSDLEEYKSGDIALFDCGKQKPQRVLNQIADRFIAPHRPRPDSEYGVLSPKGAFSMLVYGPPGTSKTTIAKALAGALNFQLVVITMSDFLYHGESALEARAKMIFDILGELENVVVLFDEIDNLVLDRESKLYERQAGIFQFMTNSMLVKLNDLRQRRNLIYIIATNFVERIDAAIKRLPRIDCEFQVLPFDQESRERLLRILFEDRLRALLKEKSYPFLREDTEPRADIEEKVQKWCKERLDEIQKLAEITPLYVYEELKQVVDDTIGTAENIEMIKIPDKASMLETTPRIVMDTRHQEFSKFVQREIEEKDFYKYNYEEYISLCMLLAESQPLEEEVKSNLHQLWTRLGKTTEGKRIRYRISRDNWKREQLPKIGIKD